MYQTDLGALTTTTLRIVVASAPIPPPLVQSNLFVKSLSLGLAAAVACDGMHAPEPERLQQRRRRAGVVVFGRVVSQPARPGTAEAPSRNRGT